MNECRSFAQSLRERFDVTSFDLEVSLKVTHQPLVRAGERVAEETERVGQLVGDDVFDESTDSCLIRPLQLQAPVNTKHTTLPECAVETTCLRGL